MKRVSRYLLFITFCTLSITYELIGQQKDNKIIFLSNHDDIIQVYSMNSDGSNIKRLTKSPERKYIPKVSPTVDNIIFTNEKSELIICDIDGRNERVISKKKEYCSTPSWSHDGKKILFASTRGGYKDSDGDPVSNIWIMDVNGTNAEQLTFSNYSNNSPKFSPDVTKIVFCSKRDKIFYERSEKTYYRSRSQIYIMNSDGSDQKRLTPLNHSINYNYPTFSPDGNKILYTMNYANADSRNDWAHIYIMDINGDHSTRLSDVDDNHLNPSFNSSGDKIIFSDFFDVSWKIMTMDINGSNRVRISKDNYSNHNASFYTSNAQRHIH